MNVKVLQAKITEQTHLLSHQKDCLERLLFQLEFNSYTRINVVGHAGSGRSTLALAVAEIFSEQSNIALLNASTQHSTIAAQVAQQWFGKAFDPNLSFEEQVSAEVSDLPLLLLLDDADLLSEQHWQMLNRLPCLLVSFSQQPLSDAELILTLNKITLDDAEVLLKLTGLNRIEIADKYASANGNLNLLLAATSTAAAPKPEIAPTQLPINSLIYLVISVTLVVLAYALWPETNVVKSSESQLVDSTIQPLDRNDVAIKRQKEDDAAVVANTTGVELNSSSSAVNDSESEKNTDRLEQQIIEDTDVIVAQTELASDNHVAVEASAIDEQDIDSASALIQSLPESAKFAADEEILLNMPKSGFAVQLSVLSSFEALERFKADYHSIEIYCYQRNWQGMMQWVAILAPYDDNDKARYAITALPEPLKSSGLFVKALQAVQAEIRARQLSMQVESGGN